MSEEKKKKAIKIDPKEIIDAWMTSINPTDLERKRADARMKICEQCENRDKGVFYFCKECHCILAKKVYSRVVNPCPEKKWKDVDAAYFLDDSVKKSSIV